MVDLIVRRIITISMKAIEASASLPCQLSDEPRFKFGREPPCSIFAANPSTMTSTRTCHLSRPASRALSNELKYFAGSRPPRACSARSLNLASHRTYGLAVPDPELWGGHVRVSRQELVDLIFSFMTTTIAICQLQLRDRRSRFQLSAYRQYGVCLFLRSARTPYLISLWAEPEVRFDFASGCMAT